MDMEVERKDGETHLIDLCENGSLLNQSNKLKRAKASSLYLTENIRGQSLLIVKFDNNTVWMPKWDEVNFLWCYAFLTEFGNMLSKEPDATKPKTYNPQKHLIAPLLDFMNNEIGAWKLELVHSPIVKAIDLVKSQPQT